MATLKEDAIKAIELAREVALEKFGETAVNLHPRLVTDIALLMAQLHSTSAAVAVARAKKN